MDIPTPDFLPEAPAGLDGHGDLTPAEIALVRAALAGRECKRGDRRPEAGENRAHIRVRAELVRFLARGGNEAYSVDPKGVDVAGAQVCGELDLMACRDLRPLRLFECHLTGAPLLLDAAGQIVSIQRCALPGLDAGGLSLSGTLFLGGSEVSGCVRVLGARIGGDLDCGGAKLTGRDADGDALFADRAEIGGYAFLINDFEASGCVRVVGTRIGGDLDCDGSKLTGWDGDGNALVADGAEIGGSAFLRKGFEAAGCVRLPGARIGGDLACEGARFGGASETGLALFMQNAKVEGGFVFRKLPDPPAGIVDLTGATVGTLVDDLAAWPEPEGGEGGSGLDGFRYDRIIGPVDFGTRKAWLLRQRPDHLCEDFKPQPFEQLAKVLRETGHTEDARRIAILKRQYQRRAAWVQAKARARRRPGAGGTSTSSARGWARSRRAGSSWCGARSAGASTGCSARWRATATARSTRLSGSRGSSRSPR